MKRFDNELDVDFIGGGPAPTQEELKMISDFIAKRKLERQAKEVRNRTPKKEPTQRH